MKKILFTLSMFCVACTIMAVPAKPGLWKTIRLADGQEIRVELRGDEFGHFWTSEQGKHYVETIGSPFFHEVTIDDIALEASARRATQSSLASRLPQKIGQKKVPGASGKTFEGQKKGLIILVNFADTKLEDAHDNDYYERFANEVDFTDEYGNTHSVRDFFLAQSEGVFDLSFDIAGPIELPRNHSYYGHTNEEYGMEVYEEMAEDACDGAFAEGINFADYDWDGDGVVEQVFLIYAGHGASDTGDMSCVWPHKGEIPEKDYNGTIVSVYACSCELAGDGAGNGIGTVCHEFSHCMGLPDAYDTMYTGFYGMGSWSLMSSGSYNGGSYGYMPAGYTSYERACSGWLTPIELTEETEVTSMKGLTEGGEAYIIYNTDFTDEFYMLENRTATGFDSALSGEGMLILHLDYSQLYWNLNIVNSYYNTNRHERYFYIPADNTRDASTESGDTWPYGDNRRLDNSTTPTDSTFNRKDGEYYMNISISRITRADDGTISFIFYPDGQTPTYGTQPEGATFYESFNLCAGLGGNDGLFGGEGVGQGEFYPDNDDWKSTSSFGANACAMFGSSTQVANLTTPTLTIDGEATISFRIAPYAASTPGQLTLSSTLDDFTLSTTEIDLPQGEWTNVSLTIYGKGDTKLRLRETSGVNRFFLDEVALVPVVSEGITTIPTDRTTRRGVYSLEGIYLGETTNGLKKGVYIVDGHKYKKD